MMSNSNGHYPSPTEEDEIAGQDKPVAAAERLISILDAFIGANPYLTLSEIARRTGLYKSTILRLMVTLLSRGYLVRTNNGEFHVGPICLQLGAAFQNAVQPQDVVVPVLRQLVEQTRETASYVVPRGDFRICLYRVDSPQVLRDHGAPGDISPLKLGAAGHIFTAFSEPENPEYRHLREQMFAITYGELHKGMAGIAAPVFDHAGKVIGMIGLTGPETRFGPAAVARMQEPLLLAARTVTERIGGDTALFDQHS